MAASEKPLLMLIAIHVKSVWPMLYLFWRVRRLAQILQRQPGALRVHRWLSRRSLLVMAWWRDRAAAEAWLNHPAQRQMVEWAEARSDLGLWIELYQLTAEGVHIRARGSPEAAPVETEQGEG